MDEGWGLAAAGERVVDVGVVGSFAVSESCDRLDHMLNGQLGRHGGWRFRVSAALKPLLCQMWRPLRFKPWIGNENKTQTFPRSCSCCGSVWLAK